MSQPKKEDLENLETKINTTREQKTVDESKGGDSTKKGKRGNQPVPVPSTSINVSIRSPANAEKKWSEIADDYPPLVDRESESNARKATKLQGVRFRRAITGEDLLDAETEKPRMTAEELKEFEKAMKTIREISSNTGAKVDPSILKKIRRYEDYKKFNPEDIRRIQESGTSESLLSLTEFLQYAGPNAVHFTNIFLRKVHEAKPGDKTLARIINMTRTRTDRNVNVLVALDIYRRYLKQSTRFFSNIELQKTTEKLFFARGQILREYRIKNPEFPKVVERQIGNEKVAWIEYERKRVRAIRYYPFSQSCIDNERAAAMFAGPYEGVDAKQQLTFQAKCAVQVFSSFYGQGDLGAQLKRLRSVYEVYEEMAPLKAKARADGTYCKNSENLFGYFEFAGIKINMHNLPDKPSEWDEYFYKMGWSVKPRNGNSEDGAPFTRGIKKISTYSYFLENMDSVMTLCNEYGSKRLFGMFPEMFYQTLKPKAELIDLTTPYNPDNPPGN